MFKSKFNLYDIVRIDSKEGDLSSVNGKKGIISGTSQSEEAPSIFAYGVSILDDNNEPQGS